MQSAFDPISENSNFLYNSFNNFLNNFPNFFIIFLDGLRKLNGRIETEALQFSSFKWSFHVSSHNCPLISGPFYNVATLAISHCR